MNKDFGCAEDWQLEREASIKIARDILRDRDWYMASDEIQYIVEAGKTLKRDTHGNLTSEGRRKLFSSTRAEVTAQWLLQLACTRPRLLRDFAEVIYDAQRNDAVGPETKRPIAWELVAAYEQCAAFPPTLPEVRQIFIARKNFRWPTDFYARRVLKSLRLELRPAKRGCPRKTIKISTVNS
jgi:hypothetical protein